MPRDHVQGRGCEGNGWNTNSFCIHCRHEHRQILIPCVPLKYDQTFYLKIKQVRDYCKTIHLSGEMYIGFISIPINEFWQTSSSHLLLRRCRHPPLSLCLALCTCDVLERPTIAPPPLPRHTQQNAQNYRCFCRYLVPVSNPDRSPDFKI